MLYIAPGSEALYISTRSNEESTTTKFDHEDSLSRRLTETDSTWQNFCKGSREQGTLHNDHLEQG